MTSDAQAFNMIRSRLELEVGELLKISTKKQIMPFWAFLRMLFPIAESLGDLTFRKKSSSENLIFILKKEYAKHNSNYKRMAGLIVQLYRHSLTHQDLLREVKYKGVIVSWGLMFDWSHSKHLEVQKKVKLIRITFNIDQFYKDTLAVCRSLYYRNFGGKAGRRYDRWKKLTLSGKNRGEKLAIKEIKSL